MLWQSMEKTPSERLHEIVSAIPAGDVSATARRSGVNVRYLMKMRGEVVNVGVDTFAKICLGLNRTADELLGLPMSDSALTVSAIRDAEREFAKLKKQIADQRKALERVHSDLGRILGR